MSRIGVFFFFSLFRYRKMFRVLSTQFISIVHFFLYSAVQIVFCFAFCKRVFFIVALFFQRNSIDGIYLYQIYIWNRSKNWNMCIKIMVKCVLKNISVLDPDKWKLWTQCNSQNNALPLWSLYRKIIESKCVFNAL